MTQQPYLHLPPAISYPRIAGVLRMLALLGLFLLPIQMRAGTNYLHPHALLQLLLDVADHEIDHHHPAAQPVPGHGDHSNHAPRVGTPSSDLPTFESIQMAAGGLAVTLVTVALFLLASTRECVWPRSEVWTGRRLRPELPPPRLSGA